MSYAMDNKQFQDPESGQPVSVQEIEHALRWIPPPPQYKQFPGIPRPVAIPQIQPKSLISGPMPFMRAFAPCLLPHTITPEQFVAFIDNYAVAGAPSPAFQGMQLVSTGIGFVPHHWAQAASGAIGLAAGAGTQVVAAARTKLYLKKVNEDFFNRRGLRASVVGDDDLRNITREDPRQAPLVPANPSAGVTTFAERRLKALDRYIAPLSFDVPPPEAQTNTLDRLSAKQVNAKIKKNREKALKQARKHGGSDHGQHLDPGDESKSRSRSGSRSSFDDRYGPTTELDNFAAYPSGDSGYLAENYGNPASYSPGNHGVSSRETGYPAKDFGYSTRNNPYPQNDGYPPRDDRYPQGNGYQPRDDRYLQGNGYPSRDTGHPSRDPAHAQTESKKIRELNLKMQEINLKAEREMMKEDKDRKRDKIDREREKKISEVQDKIDKEMRHGHSRNSSEDFDRPRDRSKHEKKRDRSADKAENKDVKAAGKLKWIVIQNL
ncbi:hypothetical protein EDD37DRAFT_299913 [Exophiala viscosa]|uniref:uncharacterized protein n=1 Tax=Exophiala viscosa TaxID=2486360 RepID=UPI002198730D|nr:hypothetical protein EDD37DRAFT_299913 [Exophiala viscosa]